MQIEVLTSESRLLDQKIEYFWECWGSDTNFPFYKDCIEHSFSKQNPLPKFYILLDGEEIIGSYALLVNDLISRQDLRPWFACFYVNEVYRNRGLGEKLLTHGLAEAKKKGFDNLYLSTNLEGFYERKGWKYYTDAYGVSGDQFKVYAKSTG